MIAPVYARSICAALPLFFASLLPARAAETFKTLHSFGVTVQHGQPVYPLPTNVALGLYDPDPLLDLAYYHDGKVQVWRNLGNGTFGSEPVYEQRVNGDVAMLEFKKSRMWTETIFDKDSWGDLHVTYTNGLTEKISHEWMNRASKSFASLPQMTSSFPPLNFVEKWRSEPNVGLGTQCLVADLDNEGKNEIVYMFYPSATDTLYRLVVYKCVGNDSFVVQWDTTTSTIIGVFGISDIDNDGHKEIVVGFFPRTIPYLPRIALLECLGPGQFRFYDTNIGFQRPLFKVVEADVNHNGVKDLVVLTSDGHLSYDNTFIYISEFVFKGISPPSPSGWMMAFNQELARCDFYVTDLAVGQVDGIGRDEIVLGIGGSLGITEPIPILYLWYNGVPGPFAWVVRKIRTGLWSDDGALRFVNLDADTTMELIAGGAGPPGHGSMYAIKYLHDTTWSVLWADSSLLNGPLWVNSGMLQSEFVVAGANTWAPRLDTVTSQLHVYHANGFKRGVWEFNNNSIQQFHFGDIDQDGITNLIFASLGGLRTGYDDRLRDFEYDTVVTRIVPTEIADRFEVFQNYPNPFNPNTTIAFLLKGFARVTITVYNVLGEEVARILNEELDPGKHKASWNGRNSHGNEIGSGVYLYRVEALDASGTLFTSTKKMILLR